MRWLEIGALFAPSVDPIRTILVAGKCKRVHDPIIIQDADLKILVGWC
jgi:hypothetical protein